MYRPFARYLAHLDTVLARGAARERTAAPGALRWLLRWALICVLAGLVLYLAGGHQAGFLTLNAAARVLPDGLWQVLTMLGDERVLCAFALLFARRHPRVLWTLLCAALIAALYSRGLKPLLDIPRPPALLPLGDFTLIGPMRRFHSFPSGHSVTAGVFFGVLIYYIRGVGWRALFTLLAVGAGLSRVAVGVHWPVDVAAGLAGGVLAVPLGAWVAGHWRWGLCNVRVHLALVAVATLVTLSLLFDDGGYPAAALPLRALALAALAMAGIGYGLLPALGMLRRAISYRASE